MPRRYQPDRSSPRAGRVASAGLPARGRLPGQPPCVGQRVAQQELDLGVRAASSSSAHLARGVMNGRIQLSLSVAGRTVGM
jgi:hypothetical protein